MGCIYTDNDGMCTLYDGSIEMFGVNEEGYCICDDDPEPIKTCEDYNSDDENNDDLDLENEEE